MKHANLSIFVPHVGCPNQCSFCNQRSISGTQVQPTKEYVEQLCLTAEKQLDGRCSDAEIAFFGGSFTAIDKQYMFELLQAAEPFIHKNVFKGIRISTRPDAINDDILDVLKKHGVTSIELGAQSMSDTVLNLNFRGHTAADVKNASKLIKKFHFQLGLQMMTGLYGSNEQMDCKTAEQLVELEPDTIRVYPTIVVNKTVLADYWRKGIYQSQTLDNAVALGAWLIDLFELQNKIPIIRMGLHAQDSLQNNMLAGPYHPAYRELCEGRLLVKQIIKQTKNPGTYILQISPQSISKLTGHGGQAIEKLNQLGYNVIIRQDSKLTGLDIIVKEV